MTTSLSPAADAHRREASTTDPWVLLVEVQTPDDPPERLRLTSWNQRLEWGEDSEGVALLWYPAPMELGPIEASSEGDLPTVDLRVGLAGAAVRARVDAWGGLAGQEVRVRLLSTRDLSAPTPVMDGLFEVVGSGVTDRGVTLRLAAFNLHQAKLPNASYLRGYCRYAEFGGAQCGYNRSAPGAAFTACPRTWDACIERGDDEVARGLQRLHPMRFGGHPGIPG